MTGTETRAAPLRPVVAAAAFGFCVARRGAGFFAACLAGFCGASSLIDTNP